MIKAERFETDQSSENTITRRNFTQGMGLLLLSPSIGYPAIQKAIEAGRVAELNRDFSGFDELSLTEYNNLYNEYSERIIDKGVLSNTGETQQITFDISEDQPILVTIQPTTQDFSYAQPLIVTSDQHNYHRKYLTPVIHSSHANRKLYSKIQLGNHSEGSHILELSQDTSSSFVTDKPMHYAVSTFDENSLLAKFIKHSPVIQIKNSQNIMDDMPIASFCKILKKEDRYQVITTLVMSSQNGGLEPSENLSSYGKIYDVEWVMQQLYDKRGNLIHNRQRYQRRGHGVQRYNSQNYGDQPYLYTATPNNNFSDGKIRFLGFEFDDPRLSNDGNVVIYSSVPSVVPGGSINETLLKRHPDITHISLNEIFKESCVEFVEDEHRADFDESDLDRQILSAQEYMNGVYINRNCRRPVRIYSSNVRNP